MAIDAYVSEERSQRPLSDIRLKLLDLLDQKVPRQGLSSDDPVFAELTGGWTTKSLNDWWDSHPPGTKGALFTTCNAFFGCIAKKLGATKLLAHGPLFLNLADKDVPGSWVPVDPTGADRPRP